MSDKYFTIIMCSGMLLFGILIMKTNHNENHEVKCMLAYDATRYSIADFNFVSEFTHPGDEDLVKECEYSTAWEVLHNTVTKLKNE